jgi:hypothetical protein
MGGIQCITPFTSVSYETNIKKLDTTLAAQTIKEVDRIQLHTFQRTDKEGLSNIKINDVYRKKITNEVKLLPSDFLWIYGKWKDLFEIPGWNGFMENITLNKKYSKSRILCLPFLNSPPSKYDTIYSVLLTAVEKCKSLNQSCCFVTFDQPLYIKARDIVASCSTNSEVSLVTVRLGGFHLLMSFMGAIGYIMDGSGLQDLFSVAYAVASTEKMLTGHAY